MIIEESDYLAHYGILRKSGRYPWGSGGDDPNYTSEQRNKDFLEWVTDLKRRLGWSDKQIADSLEISTTELRAAKSIAKNQQKAANVAMAQRLKDKGYSNIAIGERMGLNESSVRALLAPGAADSMDVLTTTANVLKKHVEEKKYLEVGSGTENHIGVSQTRLNTAIAMLADEGYKIHYVRVPQLGTNKETTMKVLTEPGVTGSEVWKNRDQIRAVPGFSDDGGRTFFGIAPPLSVDPKRVQVKYGDEGGAEADGVIYVRPGVDDISLGGSRYAQVRIQVGEDRYLKGMAIYKDDLPDGVDLQFNTNKTSTGNKLDAMKSMRDKDGNIDPDNPFGSYIKRQIVVRKDDGTEVATSAMNIVNEEGSWGGGSINPKTGEPHVGWSKSIASQVLSKQSPELAKAQLGITYERRQQEFKEIMALTNPTVRKKLLEEFADSTDSAAVHLKAAALPRQKWQVILPVGSLPDTQIYAPGFRDGERVALIRYPHGGTFEIPELVVNNRHPESVRIFGKDPKDAVGISPKVAERLSGADFDGDTVLVIPNNNNRIQTSPALRQLKGFDPRSAYPAYEGMPKLSETRKQREMGDVSNLITDMTIKGASHDEIARAVRHSMVVIDAEKHNLNYKQSAIDNGINQLKQKYQGKTNAGAATLISLAKSPVRVPERIERRASKGGPIDPVTGKRVYEYTGRTYVNGKGEEVSSTSRSRRLAEVDDAAALSSGTRMERLYVEHSNRLKKMANEARLAQINTPRATYSPSAAKTYAPQVAALNAKLDLAVRNRPLERQAQVLANSILRQRRDQNPNMDDDTIKKIKYQALEEARRRTGASKSRIRFTPDEWEAIQAGAISDSKLSTMLDNSDMDSIRALATPRTKLLMTPALTNRAQQMLASGYTRAEVADALGVSTTTLDVATTMSDG